MPQELNGIETHIVSLLIGMTELDEIRWQGSTVETRQDGQRTSWTFQRFAMSFAIVDCPDSPDSPWLFLHPLPGALPASLHRVSDEVRKAILVSVQSQAKRKSRAEVADVDLLMLHFLAIIT